MSYMAPEQLRGHEVDPAWNLGTDSHGLRDAYEH